MRWWLERLYMRLRLGRDLERQIVVTLTWMSEVATESDHILVDFSHYRRYFYFEFPLRIGDPPKVGTGATAGKETLIIRKPGAHPTSDDQWFPIFSSPAIEIWEAKSRASDIPPLRWKLTEEEKRSALSLARMALTNFLQSEAKLEQKELSDLHPRFRLTTDIDVALWVGGQLRGSHVIENRVLWQGIVEAAVGASRDVRFKPLQAEELPRARIEITLMLQPRIPLTNGDRRENRILPEKGYLLREGSAHGWYLPEVFNIRRFQNLDNLVMELAREKAGIAPAAAVNAELFIFEVDDFIESFDHQRALTLWGPIIQPTPQLPTLDSRFQILDSRLRMAADWLCRIQEPDGNLPPIIDPFAIHKTQIDWPRMAFVTWALAEFGKAVSEDAYLDAAQRAFTYLKRFLLENPMSLSQYTYYLSLAYLGQLALTLAAHREAARCAERILPEVPKLAFEPILFTQIASFFGEYARFDRRYLEPGIHCAAFTMDEFEKAERLDAEMVLAQWAELTHAFARLAELTGAAAHHGASERIINWLQRQQLPSGAFPGTTRHSDPYTRGTSKVFEVLARTRLAQSRAATEKALEWLLAMQYDGENTFFIPEEMRARVLGGFRHDDLNQEAWIDSAGHVLLGGAALNKTLWQEK